MSTPLDTLLELSSEELRTRATKLGLEAGPFFWRDGVVAAIASHGTAEPFGCGVLEVHGEGFGFLRSPYDDLLPGQDDIYVSQSQIKRFALRTGDTVIGRIRPPKESERYAALLRVDLVNGEGAEVEVVPFDEHDAVHPSARLPVARDPWLAAVDWVAPLGLGARGLLVGSSRSQRTEVLRRLANAFAADDTVDVCVLLPGERPEDVTEWRESTDVEVIATPFDELPSRHLQVVDIAFERARRQAERGAEVLLLVDGMSRLVRFALADTHPSGHVVDGIDSAAILRLRRWLATGRDLRDAGSVTLVVTLDLDHDDPLSAALHRDLVDTATWQLTLRPPSPTAGDRPAVDVSRSWTRREELLVPGDELDLRRRWRGRVSDDPVAQDEALEGLFHPAPVPPVGSERSGS